MRTAATAAVLTLSLIALTIPALAAKPGKLSFEGRYEYRTDAVSRELLHERICFYPTQPSPTPSPRGAQDARMSWFCFDDTGRAAERLGLDLRKAAQDCGVGGTATVQVSDYRPTPGDAVHYDMARLLSASQVSAPEHIPCGETAD